MGSSKQIEHVPIINQNCTDNEGPYDKSNKRNCIEQNLSKSSSLECKPNPIILIIENHKVRFEHRFTQYNIPRIKGGLDIECHFMFFRL